MPKQRRDYQKRSARTQRKLYGRNFHARIGKKGGQNNPKKFDEKSGRAAVNKRWENYRKRKAEGEIE